MYGRTHSRKTVYLFKSEAEQRYTPGRKGMASFLRRRKATSPKQERNTYSKRSVAILNDEDHTTSETRQRHTPRNVGVLSEEGPVKR